MFNYFVLGSVDNAKKVRNFLALINSDIIEDTEENRKKYNLINYPVI